jgi:hypothetical protein
MQGKFIGPISKKRRASLAPGLRVHMLHMHAVCISLRQGAEWGMRALQGTFCRLKARLPSDNWKREKIIYSVVHLSNFRAAKVGLNQIKTVFAPYYERVINVDGYDRIAKFYR